MIVFRRTIKQTHTRTDWQYNLYDDEARRLLGEFIQELEGYHHGSEPRGVYGRGAAGHLIRLYKLISLLKDTSFESMLEEFIYNKSGELKDKLVSFSRFKDSLTSYRYFYEAL